jgi:hypothetical protein
MVSFSEAVNVQQDTTPNDDPAKVYRGLVDSDWVVGV